MVSRFFFSLLVLSAILCNGEETSEKYNKFEGACAGNPNDMTKTYGPFINATLTGPLLETCSIEYFSEIPTTCDSNHTECVVGDVLCNLKCRNWFRSLCGIVATGVCFIR